MAAPVQRPHFWLLSEPDRQRPRDGWRFILRCSDGSRALEACDSEPGIRGERLELLAVVRGLEALDQPSRVTLITPSHYVKQGLAYGLPEWRENGWSWERFGQMAPVKHRDLWQRLDRALRYHQVDCRTIRIDPAHKSQRSEVGDRRGSDVGARPHYSDLRSPTSDRQRAVPARFTLRPRIGRQVWRAILRARRMFVEQVERWQVRLEQWGVVAGGRIDFADYA
jgi:ribonuclease HI